MALPNTQTTDISTIPHEIWTNVFLYLNAKDLWTVSLVCKHFHTIQDSPTIWRTQCFQLWRNKRIRKEIFYRGNYAGAISQLSVKEIKQILASRKQYTKDLIEKQEFVDLLIKSTPVNMPVLHCNKWKISYVCSVIDSYRTTITKEELCDRPWIFRFKEWGMAHPGLNATFNSDYTYSSEIFNQPLHWRFYAGNIQVEQYPPIHCQRTSDWGWRMENPMVFYLEPEYVPSK
jgi:hypothetical protein